MQEDVKKSTTHTHMHACSPSLCCVCAAPFLFSSLSLLVRLDVLFARVLKVPVSLHVQGPAPQVFACMRAILEVCRHGTDAEGVPNQVRTSKEKKGVFCAIGTSCFYFYLAPAIAICLICALLYRE